MGRFTLQVTWLDPPEPDEAFGPERTTWGELEIDLDGRALTRHASPGGTVTEATVIGGMSALAEWIVDHWMCVLWEIRTPFPKTSGRGVRVPALGDVRRGRLDHELDPSRVAAWQGRHVLGAGTSDLALPSISLLPEEREVGVLVAPPPPDRGISVRFVDLPGDPAAEPVWVSKDDIADEFGRFVASTIERARSDEGAAAWAVWLFRRLEAMVALARSEPERRRAMFGELAATKWDALTRSLGRDAAALAGVLLDSEIVDDEKDLASLAEAIQAASKLSRLDEAWKKIHLPVSSLGRKPYERGYDLATLARKELGEPVGPLTDIREALEAFGVRLEPFRGTPVFRSAAVHAEEGPPVVLQAKAHPRNDGVAPNRFAIAAALGRILGEPATGAFGAAHGPQSRWQATQQANAFAAELLLPAAALHTGTLPDLCDRYGISRSAAEWHRNNRLGAVTVA